MPRRSALLALAPVLAVLALLSGPPASASGPAPSVRYFGHTAALRVPGVTHLPRTHLPRPLHAAASAHAIQELDSRNWSGYAVQACASCRLRYTETQFSLPSVHCAGVTGTQVASFWAGLDGLSSATVEQTGVDAFCVGSSPSYVAWYEMYPGPPVVLSLPVSAGDAMDASVFYTGTGYQLTLTDATAGVGSTVTASCPAGSTCANTSAEAIAEAPFDGSAQAFVPLADFAKAFFSGSRVTSRNGTRGGLDTTSLWTASRVVMFNGAHELASPGFLASGQVAPGVPSSDFGVTWEAAS